MATAASALPPIPPNIAQLTTPILVGAILDYFLFGILTLQLYVYSYSFGDDAITVKLLIWFIYLIELAQVCCAAADIYYWFGAGYGNMIRLNTTYISPFDTPFMASFVALVIQLFFCYRIYKLRKNNWYIVVVVLIAAISVVQTVGGMYGAITAHIHKYFTDVRFQGNAFIYMWLVGEAVADVVIAVTMTYLLLASQNEFTMQSRSIVNRIIRLIIHSNTLTAGVAILSVILFVGWPSTNYFLTTTIILGKLYSNTLFATFNHRIFLRRAAEDSSKKSHSHTSSSEFSSARPAMRSYA